jgi:hypothetical protein
MGLLLKTGLRLCWTHSRLSLTGLEREKDDEDGSKIEEDGSTVEEERPTVEKDGNSAGNAQDFQSGKKKDSNWHSLVVCIKKSSGRHL